MNVIRLTRETVALVLAMGLCPTVLLCQSRAIDVDHSELKIRVFKGGFLSAFAHDYEIEAQIAGGPLIALSMNLWSCMWTRGNYVCEILESRRKTAANRR